MTTGRRLKRIDVTPQVFPLMFTTDNVTQVTDGVPPKSMMVNYGYDSERDMFYFHIEHPTFETVPEGETPPAMDIEVEDIDPDTLAERLED